MATTNDLISYERRIKCLESENRELMQKADRIDGSTSPSSGDEMQKMVEQMQVLTKQNQGRCVCVCVIFFFSFSFIQYRRVQGH